MAILWSVGDAAASIFPGLLSPADLLLCWEASAQAESLFAH